MNKKLLDNIQYIVIGFSIIILASIIIFVIQFNNNEAKNVFEDIKNDTIEHNALTAMNCKQLGEWLIENNYTHKDNLEWAQNHYMVKCK